MKIAVFGATGQVGRRVVSYALVKGHTVRAFGRNVDVLIDEDLRSDDLEAIRGSVFDAEDVWNAVEGVDAVISVLGGAFDGEDKTRSLGMKTIVQQMHKAGVKRIVALGGSGVLSTPDGTFILDQPDYPPEYLPVGREHLLAYQQLEKSDLIYTFVCSPDIRDGEATGDIVTSDTYPPLPNKGFVTAGDLAHFMVNELTANEHTRQRVGISAR